MLAAVGMCVVVVFGLQAWRASTDVASNQAALRALADVTNHAPVDTISREELAARRPFDLVAAAAERELARSRVAVGLGVAMLLLGLATLVRDGVVRARHASWTRGDSGTPGPTRRLLSATMRGLGALTEATLTAPVLLFLMVFGATAVSRLFHGVPKTRELVDQALNRTLDDVVVLVGMLV